MIKIIPIFSLLGKQPTHFKLNLHWILGRTKINKKPVFYKEYGLYKVILVISFDYILDKSGISRAKAGIPVTSIPVINK